MCARHRGTSRQQAGAVHLIRDVWIINQEVVERVSATVTEPAARVRQIREPSE
jgi:hypothetical protein